MLGGVTGRIGMAARRAAAQRTQAIGQQSRGMATQGGVYSAIMSSNAKYVTFVVAGAAVGEVVYGFMGDTVWKLNNRGKLYEDIDWSKWDSLYKDEDEE